MKVGAVVAAVGLGLALLFAVAAEAKPRHSVFGACVDKGEAPCTVKSAQCSERCHGSSTCLTACRKSFTVCRNDVIQACQQRGQTGHVTTPRTHVAPR